MHLKYINMLDFFKDFYYRKAFSSRNIFIFGYYPLSSNPIKFLKNLLHGIYGFLSFNFSECNKDSLKDLLPALHAPKIYKHVRFLQRLLLAKKMLSSWNICISENYPPSSIPSKLPKISQKSVAGNLWLFQFQFESILNIYMKYASP